MSPEDCIPGEVYAWDLPDGRPTYGTFLRVELDRGRNVLWFHFRHYEATVRPVPPKSPRHWKAESSYRDCPIAAAKLVNLRHCPRKSP